MGATTARTEIGTFFHVNVRIESRNKVIVLLAKCNAFTICYT